MKKNLLYLAGFLLAAATVFSGYNDDNPSYHDSASSTQKLIINLDETPEGIIQIIQGNGDYRITSSNEDAATAIAEGNRVKVTALKAGSTDSSIIDWAKMSTNVRVIVDQLSELALPNSATAMYLDENKTVNAYTRNRGYKVTVDKEPVVKATVDEEGHMQIESLAPGNATVTVTDRLGKSAEFPVKIIKKLAVSNSEKVAYLIVGEPLTIKILDGNGSYTYTNNSSTTYLKCTIVESGTDVIIEGLKRCRFSKTVTTKDQEGESIGINIVYINDLYLKNPSYRYLIAGSSSYQSVSTSVMGSITHPEEFNMSEIAIEETRTYANGFAVQSAGDLTEGNKGDVVLYKATRNVVNKKAKYPIEDCRIGKMEDGWYWVSFSEPNCTIRPYIITKQQFIGLTHVSFESTPILSK